MFYQKLINEFIVMSNDIIENNLSGIYLHGSMAMGCFNPEKSDIDLIIIIKSDITDMQKVEYLKRIVKLNEQAPVKGLEISIVKREYCNPFVYPTPYELHFSPIHQQRFINNPEFYVKKMKGVDKDLAAHVTMINKHGIVLYGEPIEHIFGEVLKKDFSDSIFSDVEGAIEVIKNDPMYMTLNLCRTMAFLEEDLYLSKQQGGEWGIENISDKYHPLILQALNCYQTDLTMQADMELAVQFADEMLTMIGIIMK